MTFNNIHFYSEEITSTWTNKKADFFFLKKEVPATLTTYR